MAITTRARVAPGPAGVTPGQRRGVDSQGCRGQRELTMGGHGVNRALRKGDERSTCVHLSPEADPVPAMAANIQPQKPSQLCCALEVQDAVA